MSEVVSFEDDLNIFQNVVMLYRDENSRLYIGNTYYYNGRGNLDYMSVMYKEELPEEKGIMMGWNYLDDNSARVTLVPTDSMCTGVEDFLYAHGKLKDWKSVEYHTVNDYQEIERYVKSHPIKAGQAIGFGIRK